MIAGRLTHRAEIERNQATGTDAWGGDIAPVFQQVHAALPCFAWSKQSRELVDGSKTAMIEDLRVMFALDADVQEADEIVAISDRAGTVVMQGRLKVEGRPQFKHNHIEAALQRIG
ncbi:MAG: hypothetical protein AAGK02_15090 [Pseudomonadota bacterium]